MAGVAVPLAGAALLPAAMLALVAALASALASLATMALMRGRRRPAPKQVAADARWRPCSAACAATPPPGPHTDPFDPSPRKKRENLLRGCRIGGGKRGRRRSGWWMG